VVAVRDDPATVEHDDLIRQGDRGEAVSDDERGPPRHRLVEREEPTATIVAAGFDRLIAQLHPQGK